MSGLDPMLVWAKLTNELAFIHDRALHLMSGALNPDNPARWVGKTVVIGLTYEDEDGVPQRREQLWGEITDINAVDGIVVQLKGANSGETYFLPPVPSRLRVARRGVYQLNSTGEKLSNPDFTSAWIVSEPA